MLSRKHSKTRPGGAGLRAHYGLHARLKQLAASRHTSVNRLLVELATTALVHQDLTTQFAPLPKAEIHSADWNCWISWIGISARADQRQFAFGKVWLSA